MTKREGGLTAFRRGHPIRKTADGRWRWSDSGRYLRLGSNPTDPPCAACSRPPTSDGRDPCIGNVGGAISVCCGHGATAPHVTFTRGAVNTLPSPALWSSSLFGYWWP